MVHVDKAIFSHLNPLEDMGLRDMNLLRNILFSEFLEQKTSAESEKLFIRLLSSPFQSGGGKQTLLKQFSIILSIYFLGELIQKISGLPIPGNVIGMLILFFGLYTGIIKLETIGKISDFLLENLAFFFLPAGVSLMTSFGLLEGKWTSILEISLISTLIVLVVTGLTVEFVQRVLRLKAEFSSSKGDDTNDGIDYKKDDRKGDENYLEETQKELMKEPQKIHVLREQGKSS
jgi:holin-like protein